MDRISNVNRLVVDLKKRLQGRSQLAVASAVQTPEPQSATQVSPVVAMDSADDQTLARALIQELLLERLGPALINDARFQQIVDKVVQALAEDPTTARLLANALSDLRPVTRA